jgi:hypothetical protein
MEKPLNDFPLKLINYFIYLGAHGSLVVKALCYKPEGSGFDNGLGDFLNLRNPSDRTKPWGLLSL